MGEPKVPVFVAVGAWFAAALAVASYTYIAFKETANGAESGAWGNAEKNPLATNAQILKAEGPIGLLPNVKDLPGGNQPIQKPFKPLERDKFPRSK